MKVLESLEICAKHFSRIFFIDSTKMLRMAELYDQQTEDISLKVGHGIRSLLSMSWNLNLAVLQVLNFIDSTLFIDFLIINNTITDCNKVNETFF